MDWLEFWSSVIGSLAWPLAAVFLGFLFREQVRALLAKMKSLKAPGIEAFFTEQVQEVKAEAKQVESGQAQAAVAHHGAVPSGEGPEQLKTAPYDWLSWARELDQQLTERPTAIVLNAWNEVEVRMRQLLSAYDMTATERPLTDAMALERAGIIAPTTTSIIKKLYSLRNDVSHVAFEPDREAALDYAQTAHTIRSHLQALTDEHRGSTRQHQ